MRILVGAVIAVAVLATGSPLRAAEPKPPPMVPVVVSALPAGAETRPVTIANMRLAYETGQSWGVTSCFAAPSTWGMAPLKWQGIDERTALMMDEALPREMKKAGFRLVGDDSDLFGQVEGGDFAIGGVITSLNARFCIYSGLDYLSPYVGDVRGSLLMKVEWQIYSKSERRVVANFTTSGGMDLKKPDKDGIQIIFKEALADNVRALINAEPFRAAFVGPARSSDAKFAATTSKVPIKLTTAGAAAVPIRDAVGSVVTVLAGGGHGSGVLVGSEGYVLTNAHVVGDNPTVKLRWSDGFETTGEVVRVQRARDVALIKTSTHGRQPLAMSPGTLQPGTSVYAIGAPLDEKFSSTVTKGIVSANRMFDGFSYIQGDVTINAGNSGGPLLNEQGKVVALTVAMMRKDGPTGLNLFIPIGDVIDFLALDPH